MKPAMWSPSCTVVAISTRAAVPVGEQPPVGGARVCRELLEVVVGAKRGVGLGRLALELVAVHGNPQPGRGAAVVGVGVSEDDVVDPAEARARRGHRVGHVRDPGVEHRDPALVGEQVHVHPPGQSALDEPHALGDPLDARAVERAAEPGAEVRRLRQPALRR